MKKYILILFAIACAKFSFAQSITVTEETATFSTGAQNALVTTVHKNSKDAVASKWKNYLKDFKNEKVKMENNEVFGDNVLIKEWGNNPVDIYARFEENKTDNSVKLMVAFNLGGPYLSSSGDAVKYVDAQKLVRDFAIQATKFPMEEKLRTAQKLLTDMDSDQKNLEKENKDLHDDIENCKNKITKAEEDIKKNQDNQAKKKAQMDAQKIVVEQIKGEMEGVK